MNQTRQIRPANILILLLGVLLAVNLFSALRTANDVSYYELRQLFGPEKVEKFYINNTRLTAELTDERTVGCDLHNFELFYNDMNELVAQQAAALAGRNKYAALIGETYAHACITGGAGEERLLVLSDSYANAIVPLLAQHFARVDVIDPRYYAGVLADTAQEVGSTRVLALFGLNTFSNNRGLALLTIGEE